MSGSNSLKGGPAYSRWGHPLQRENSIRGPGYSPERWMGIGSRCWPQFYGPDVSPPTAKFGLSKQRAHFLERRPGEIPAGTEPF